MYTGFMLWIAGWRRLEDKRLLAQFGDTYRRYSQRTWF